jgi:hypothetical protein
MDMQQPAYPLPAFLQGRCDPSVFIKWLNVKSDSLLSRDIKRKKPYALNVTQAVYKQHIYNAVLGSGDADPYTGDALAWELIGTWDPSANHDESYKRKFALMPTVDHVTPDELVFEICSWLVNECKTYLDPQEFVELCAKVVDFRRNA